MAGVFLSAHFSEKGKQLPFAPTQKISWPTP